MDKFLATLLAFLASFSHNGQQVHLADVPRFEASVESNLTTNASVENPTGPSAVSGPTGVSAGHHEDEREDENETDDSREPAENTRSGKTMPTNIPEEATEHSPALDSTNKVSVSVQEESEHGKASGKAQGHIEVRSEDHGKND